MNSLDFLRNLNRSSANLQQSNVNTQPENPQKNVKTENPKKTFMHGNNVIFKVGEYKGYYGYVYEDDFLPGRLEIEIEEDRYVLAGPYGQQNIGNTIMTNFGKCVIKDIIPTSVVLDGDKGNVTVPETHVVRIVQYKDANQNQALGFLTSVETVDKDMVCSIQPLVLNGKETKEMYEELSTLLKNGQNFEKLSKGSVQKMDCKAFNFPDIMFFVIQGEHIGYYGIYKGYYPEKFLVAHTKNIIGFPKNIKTQNGQKSIRVGEHYFPVKHVKKLPAKISVFVDSIGKKVSEIMDKTGDRYIVRPIYPNDVFYMDLELKNGNTFEVKDVRYDTHDKITEIIGLEKNSNNYEPKTIQLVDINQQLPGFSFTKQFSQSSNKMIDEQQFTDEAPDEATFSTNEDDEDSDDATFSDNGYDNEQESEQEGEQEGEQEYKSSFKDNERSSMTRQYLTKDEKNVQQSIQKILTLLGINSDEVNVYQLIEQSSESVAKIKETVKEKLKWDKWIKQDETFVNMVLVFFEVVKNGYGHLFGLNPIEYYVSTFAKAKLIKKDYIKSSVFIQNNWTQNIKVDNNVISAFMKDKNYFELYKIIFNNCKAYLMQLLQLPDIELKTLHEQEMNNLVPLGLDRHKKHEKKLMYGSELAQGIPIPDTATHIYWGPQYTKLLSKFKNALAEKVNNSSNDETRLVYDFIIEHIEQAPFEIKRLENILATQKHLVIDRKKLNKLKSVWNQLLGLITKHYKRLEEKKRESLKDYHSEQERVRKRRQEISERNNVLNDFDDLTIEDTSEDQAERLIRKVKKLRLGSKKI